MGYEKEHCQRGGKTQQIVCAPDSSHCHSHLTTPEILFVRYFLVCITYFLLLLSYLLCYGYRLGVPGRAIYILLLVLIGFGNGLQIEDLLQKGRGHYHEALIYMAGQTEGNNITIGSDHDFRNKTVLDFYARYLPQGKRIVYFGKRRWVTESPQWIMTHHQGREYQPPAELTDLHGHHYVLDREYRYSNLSGWHWFIYREMTGHQDK